MRTLTRRGLMAGALAVLVPATRNPAVKADEEENPGLLKVRSDGSVEFDADAIRSIEQQAPEQQVAPGQLIANFALAYVGYPYVAAGNTPAGFDCSGFSQFVILNMLGWDIGHAVEGQPAAGWWVDWDGWLPGDLIFFQNTYRPGISHVGIYIGDGQIVHAENYDSGVTIDSIYSDYYGSRYYGAVRIG